MGDAANAVSLPSVQKNDGWNISPQSIISIPQAFSVPERGAIPYQTIDVDPGYREDRWIQQAEIRPGNRKVVHHATVFLRPPNFNEAAFQGELQSYCLVPYAMGTPPLVLPDGFAKKVPAGWHFVFVIHYVPGGPNQFDQTQLGVRFAEPGSVQKEVATHLLYSDEIKIPPRCPNHVETRTKRFDADVLLLALFPHMHLRGQSFRYEATYPDGHLETLLSVPRWDMNWQHRYVFSEPKRLPAGTVLTVTGVYDNSENNPNNPDPNAEVHAGFQTEDEMFNGYYDFCLADQDLTKPHWQIGTRTTILIAGVLALTGLHFMWLMHKKKMSGAAQAPQQ